MRTAVRWATWATALEIVHLLISALHSAAHAEEGVNLSAFQTVFVIGVITLAPLVAVFLLWTSLRQAGAMLFCLSMGGAFGFGLLYHFLIPGPDNVASPLLGAGQASFQLSALGIAMIEAAGCLLGLWMVRQGRRLALAK